MKPQTAHPPEWIEALTNAHEGFARASAEKYFDSALQGWVYTQLFEHEFIDPSIKPIPRKTKPSPTLPTLAQTDISPEEYFEKLRGTITIDERWARLHNIINEPSRAVLEDSFAALNGNDLQQALTDAVSGDGLNIVVLGAGCIGLSFANMMKNVMGDDINILMIENRAHKQHYKQPYSRNWLTHIAKEHIDFFDADVRGIFQRFQTGQSFGLPINAIETLLLLSCKALGVSFYFDESYDLSFIKNSGTHLIFDCTGANLDPKAGIPASHPDLQNDGGDIVIETDIPPNMHANYRHLGIKNSTDISQLRFNLSQSDGVYYPHVKGQQIQTAVIKILNIPGEHHEALLKKVEPYNEDNKFFVWAGHLDSQINRLIIHINVKKDTHETLSNMIDDPISLDQLINADLTDLKTQDPRILQFINDLKDENIDLTQIYIERPFLYTPYIHSLSGELKRFHGRAVIPLGDSVYNGNPKSGNGLGYQMPYLSNMYQGLKHAFQRLKSQ